MAISKINKIVSVITAVLVVVLLGMCALCFAHLGHTWSVGDIFSERMGEYLGFLTVPLILAFVIIVVKVVVSLVLRGRSSTEEKSNREILEIYRSGYYFSLLDKKSAKEFLTIVKRRNLIDLIGSQLASLAFIAVIDYLIFFAHFTRENLSAEIKASALPVLLICLVGVGIFVSRWIYSELQTKKAIKVIKQDKSQKGRVNALRKICKSPEFLRFKRRKMTIRIIKSVILGLCAAALVCCAFILLYKLAVINTPMIIAIYIGIGVALAIGGFTFLLSAYSDMDLAEELDRLFDLKARVQTMVEYGDDDGEMLSLQRQDTDNALSNIPLRAYKFKKLWLYITSLVLCGAILASGFVVTDVRDIEESEQVVPFNLTETQRSGLLELIKNVEKSQMEEEYRTPMVEELNALLTKLENTYTEPEMHVALAESMAAVMQITYDSSDSTEMLNALWDTDDVYFKYLAKVLDTSSWTTPDWGDFAEKLTEYANILTGEYDSGEGVTVGSKKLKWALDSMTRKLDIALEDSCLDADDRMYAVMDNLFNHPLVGFSVMLKQVDNLDDDQARALLENGLSIMSEDTYNAIAQNKINANTGEHAMTRLGAMFLVPVPEFERPDFVKNGESVENEKGDAGEDDDSNGVHSGGLGNGATFGSDDYILNPQTGEYVKLGDLIHIYYAIMYEKLQNGSYTDEQKEAITKYFDLLYSGIEERKDK